MTLRSVVDEPEAAPAPAGVDVAMECANMETMNAVERIQWALTNFPGNVALLTSFGTQSTAMLRLVLDLCPTIPVIFVDTGYLFPETYQYADQLIRGMNINLKTYQSDISPARMEATMGKLWENKTPEAIKTYNYIRKVKPMQQALEELNVQCLLTGIRAEQTEHRKKLTYVHYQGSVVKVCPILDWSNEDVDEFMGEHNLPAHPLAAQGYTTVGDVFFSRPTEANDSNERNTRFNGVVQECGLHTHDLKSSNPTATMALPVVAPAPVSDAQVSPVAPEVAVTPVVEESDEEILNRLPGPNVIFTKASCKYCVAAKILMEDNNIDFIELPAEENLHLLPASIRSRITGVPQIVLNHQYVGGYQQLSEHLGVDGRF